MLEDVFVGFFRISNSNTCSKEAIFFSSLLSSFSIASFVKLIVVFFSIIEAIEGLNINKMKNINLLNWNCSPGCDTGGMTQEWLKTQKNEDIYFIKHNVSCHCNEMDIPEGLKNNINLIDFLKNDIRNKHGQFFCELYQDVFLHYRAGSNWRGEGKNFHNTLSISLKKALLQ